MPVCRVVPAHAGVIPIKSYKDMDIDGGSRTRGGDPVFVNVRAVEHVWFPHTRG